MDKNDVTATKMLEWARNKEDLEIVGCTDSTALIGTPVEVWLKEIGLISYGSPTGETVDGEMPKWLEEYLDSTETDWMGMLMDALTDNYGERTLINAGELASALEFDLDTSTRMHHNC